MSTLQEAARAALEALQTVKPQNMGPTIHQAKECLRAAFASEPRVPLTSGQIARCMTEVADPLLWGRMGEQCGVLAEQFARAVESAHGIREQT
jgi:hypothetical protein